MNNTEFNVCFILEQEYTKIYDLPKEWKKISLEDKCNLLGLALNNYVKIEDLKEYWELINETN